MDNNLKFDFAIGIEEILEDNIDGLLDRVGISIPQGSDVLLVKICDNLML